MRFDFWPALFLILLIPLLIRFWFKRSRPPRVTYSLPIPKHVSSRNPNKVLLGLRYVALVFFILAFARPQTAHRELERQVSGIDIVITMDVSLSMNIEDLSDRSRLNIAKDTMRDFIQGRQNDRIGFVVFSGEPLTLAPATLDYGLLFSAIKNVETGVLKDGTAIGDGLALSVNRLKDSKAKSKIVILLTDGDNNIGQVDPATAGEMAATFGIRTYTIAIGTEGRVRLPIHRKGAFGQVVTSYQWFENALNPELLKHIAKITDGKFYRVTDAEALDQVFKEIDSLEKSEFKSKERVEYKDVFGIPLKIAVFFLIIEQLLRLGWWRFAL